MASKAGISKAAAEKALKAFTDGVIGALKKGNKVSLVGFGSFEVSKRAARKGRNPRTGAEIKIRASKVARFRPGRAMKDTVNS
jgi:DNA-binding protein HU-beta